MNTAKLIADIAKIAGEIYAIAVDKDLAKKNAEKDAKIALS